MGKWLVLKTKGPVEATDNVADVAKRPRAALDGAALRRYALLVGAVLLWIAAGVVLWQAWGVFNEQDDQSHVTAARDTAAVSIGQSIAGVRARAQQALSSDAVAGPLESSFDSGVPAATQAFKAAVSDALDVKFYRGDLDDVLDSDLAKLGYARAAMLMQARRSHGPAPAQTIMGDSGTRQLAFALPMTRHDKTIAYAYATFTLDPVLTVFRGSPFSSQMQLRQSNGTTDLLLSGSAPGTEDPDPKSAAVPDSLFRVDVTPGQSTIFLPHNLFLLAVLALLALLGGIALFIMRTGSLRDAIEAVTSRRSAATAEVAEEVTADPLPLSPDVPIVKQIKEDVPDVHISRSMFRAYDIRGVLGKTLNVEVARMIGQAIGSEMSSRGLKTIVVGRDGRLSGPSLSAALIDGLRAAGANVTDIGAVPTPVTYFAAQSLELGSCVSITGSHNPPDYNGFKIVLGGETLAEEAIQKLYQRIVGNDLVSGAGTLDKREVIDDYIARIASDVNLARPLKVVIDCGNGIAGAIAPKLFDRLGANVVPLYCEVDGNFPNHHPDPSDMDNLADLILTVKQVKADLGIAFDGDGDRLGIVTPAGEVIYPDRALMLFARDVLSRNAGATIIFDVKCTGKLAPVIEKAGGKPLMWRTGHSLIKGKMRETGAALAGEMSGHFFFKERWYGFDDGLYAGARLLEILSADPQQRLPEQVFETLPNSVSTPELKVDMAEGEHYKFIERFKQESKFEGATITTIDGVRADWPDGWGLVRASNTTPVLVLRFDADTMDALKRIQALFKAQLLALNPKLKLPF